MTATLNDALRADITDRASGEAWIRALRAADLDFQFDDDPAYQRDWMAPHEPLFFADDLPLIRDRLEKLEGLDWGTFGDAHGFALSLNEETP